MKRQSTVVGCILGLLAGCTNPSRPSTVTESSTYKSAAPRFWHVAVWAKTELETRQQMEKWAVGTLRFRRVDATRSLELWPIDASSDEIQALTKADNIDAVFVMTIDAPSSTSDGMTSLYGHTALATAVNEGNQGAFSAVLYNASTRRVVWQSQPFAAGNSQTTWSDIEYSVVKKTVDNLLAGKLLYLCLPPTAGLDSNALIAPWAARAEQVEQSQLPNPTMLDDDCPVRPPAH